MSIATVGGLLWRPRDAGDEVAVLHRPTFDDWSLARGKLLVGEHVLLGAVREVGARTGYRAWVGRPLGRRFWSMRAFDGRFEAGDEVDELEWVSPNAARGLVSADRDRRPLAAFAAGPHRTVPFVLARHGNAGDRESWAGPDRDRPLDPVGWSQAEGLQRVLDGFGVERVLSADVARCIDTVTGYAGLRGATVGAEPLFSESGYVSNRSAALARLLELLASAVPTVVCSQGKVIPDLLARTAETLDIALPAEPAVRKGAFWVLHRFAGTVVAAERHAPAVPLR